jgi:ABC-type nitrate/sulfonate/bicarbonate transport system, permease component
MTDLTPETTDYRAVRDEARSAEPVPSRMRPAAATVFNRVGLPVLGVAGTIGLWWWATWYFQIRTFFLPSPADVVESLTKNFETLLEQSWITVYETLAGFGIGAGAGLLIAVALSASASLQRALLPIVVALNAVPKVALAPLFMVWFGLDHAPKIAMAASICFFPIMIATMAGLASTPAELGELARSLSATRTQHFLKVRLPWAMPQVFVGLKLGMTLALIGTVVAQIARPSGGLGTMILLAQQNANTPLIFAAIVLLTVMSVALFYLVVLAERLLIPWARETADRA